MGSLEVTAAIRRLIALTSIGLIAFGVRTFSLLRYESVIHEFDPYFNYRTTRFIAKEGFRSFWNWFDAASWYPLGRVVGQTLFPGLMTTAYLLHKLANHLGLPINIRDVCAFTAPLFSMVTAWATYGLTKEVSNNEVAGMIAALIISVSSSYLSRSTGGAFDNEAIAISALVLTFYTFIRATHRGTGSSILIACAVYFYMVLAWGGYVFITNTIAIYVAVIVLLDKMTTKHFHAYVGWYAIGTLLCLNIPFVGLAAIKSAEHMSSHGVFWLCMCWKFRASLIVQYGAKVDKYLRLIMVLFFLTFCALFGALTYLGYTRFSGRSMTLLDPTYASKYVPIIASISEHQPTTWATFHLDINHSFLLVPMGIFICLMSKNESMWFLAIFGILAAYFSCVMVRLVLVLAPAAAALSGIAAAHVLDNCFSYFHDNQSSSKRTALSPGQGYRKCIGVAGICAIAVLLLRNVVLGMFAGANFFSSPSIVTSMHLAEGSRLMIDDLREAYSWLRDNTHPDARILSWWDYGYQACFMANRTIIVDNNTWNTTHIANVGLVMSNKEEIAFPILEHLDVDYVFVIYGGGMRYSGDDLNKFLWMIRIAKGEYPWAPEEGSFFSKDGEYAVTADKASQRMKESMMYRMSYWNIDKHPTSGRFDTNRNAEVTTKIKPFKYLTEAYSTSSWIVRIYRVLRRPDRMKYGDMPLQNVLLHPPSDPL